MNTVQRIQRYSVAVGTVALATFLVLLLSGCASISLDALFKPSLDRHVEQCFAFGGSPGYARAGDAVSYECKGTRR